MKYPYSYNNFDAEWKYYCKGCIINKKTNKIICIPSIKSTNINDINKSTITSNKFYLQNLLDGTMINLFFNNDKWDISTRSNIGCNNRNKNKSFKLLFNECKGNTIDYNKLNKNYTYSFVLIHKENRNISNILENNLTLVDVYDLQNFKYIYDIEELSEIPNTINKIYSNKYNNLDDIFDYVNTFKNIDYNWKGFTIKYNNNRIKILNNNFIYVKNLKNNITNENYYFVIYI